MTPCYTHEQIITLLNNALPSSLILVTSFDDGRKYQNLDEISNYCSSTSVMVLLRPVAKTQEENARIRSANEKLANSLDEGSLQASSKDFVTSVRLFNFAKDAHERGANFFVCDDYSLAHELEQTHPDITIAYHPCVRARFSAIAQNFYLLDKRTADTFRLIGITGTNGKTTCAHLCGQALALLGKDAVVIGTLGAFLYRPGANGSDVEKEKIKIKQAPLSALTTPSALQFARFRYFLQAQASRIAASNEIFICMEVSSHGIDQGRVSDLQFDIKALTNITQDHLDYHQNLSAYARVKLDWLLDGRSRAISNVQVLDRLENASSALKENVQFFQSLSTGSAQKNAIAHLVSTVQSESAKHVNSIKLEWEKTTKEHVSASFDTTLIGDFNAENLSCVALILLAITSDLEAVAAALTQVNAAPGRLEQVRLNDSQAADHPRVYVDYAHTPDALERVLITLGQTKGHNGLLWVVFGCGGDRDTGKRAQMGELAQRLCQRVVVTNDNPRSEEPEVIAEMIESGFDCQWPLHARRVLDRREAIVSTINEAANDDYVLIAGKGHEDYQIVGTTTLKFSDVDVAREALMQRAARAEIA